MIKTIKTKITLTLLAALILLSSLPACSVQTGQAASGIRAVATTGMVADVVRHVGGERVTVTGLMGAGVDPHLFKASEGNVRTLAEADIIFYSGLHLEAGMARVLERVGEQRKTVAVTQAIDPARLLAPPEFSGAHDPHVWFDVSMWKTTVNVVRDALIEIDPAGAEVYRNNAAAYLQDLETLDAYVKAQAARVPADRRVLITAHDAFNYFGRAYGFEVRGLQGISTQAEASTGDVQALARFITDRKIPAVFIESSIPRRNVEAVQAAVRARGFDVRIGGSLFSDAMGSPGTPEGSYTGMVRHNIDTIVNALLAQNNSQ